MPAGLLAFSIALVASVFLTAPVRALAIRVGMVDLPGPRKVHLQPIPLLGVLDHMDSLCTDVAAVDSSFFASLELLYGQTLVTSLAAAVLGAAAGFLRWNFKPAKIFMGDGGAMFLGFLMATLSLKLRLEHANHFASWLAPVLVLGATIFDTTLVTISRSRRGLLPFATPGKDHAAHRLANVKLGQRGAVLAMYILGAFSGSLALLVSLLPLSLSLGLIVFAVVAALSGIAFLERAPYERQTAKPAAAATD